jgi:SEC-C motif-containing protein
MRSRYSAYALHRVDYVLATTHPDGEQGTDPAAIARFCENTDFDGLEILAASQNGSRGEVEFRASLTQGGKDASFGERSVFIQVDGRWLYHSGARS